LCISYSSNKVKRGGGKGEEEESHDRMDDTIRRTPIL